MAIGNKIDADTITIELSGRIPSKKNSRINIRSGRSFPSEKYSNWHREAKEQLPNVMTNSDLLTFDIHIRFPDRRRADLTNKAESIMDLLVDAMIIKDDNWIVTKSILLTGSYDKANPGATITIKESQ